MQEGGGEEAGGMGATWGVEVGEEGFCAFIGGEECSRCVLSEGCF